MSYSVYVEGPTIEADLDRLTAAFLKRHDQNFMQTVNIDFHTGKGSYEAMTHAGWNLSPSSAGFPVYIDIPCHWDYDHMMQTEKDIQVAAKELGIEIKTTISY